MKLPSLKLAAPSPPSPRYSKVDLKGDGEYDEEENLDRSFSWLSWSGAFIVFLTAFVAGVIGFSAGRLSVPTAKEPSATTYLEPQGNVWMKMEYNSTFSRPPSERTNRAWAALYPKGVGFVKEPKVAPVVSGISVFHQLHCLDSLRGAYYVALAGEAPEQQHQQNNGSEHADHNDHDDPHHVRHCFDYLRQSLMCAADTNVEPVDMALGGSTGWGTTKTCRDYGAVRNWAERWRAEPPPAA